MNPPQDIMTSRKPVTESAKDMIAWRCSEKMFHMQSIVESAQKIDTRSTRYCTAFGTLRIYFGPYYVLRRLSFVTYELKDVGPVSGKKISKHVVHVMRIKPCHDPTKRIDTEDIYSQDVIHPEKSTHKRDDYNLPVTLSSIKT
ncbi:hypothetical protein TNCV_3666371 [Trichonephila clavipes]|uniref:Integrase p58-like C-terminal domain-containing protein n=1 Tax=Trichonephila clavipes TaxID=2585209 RepID=A0A8X6V3V4_TRICX|nr:hypothetical protein TNCV_3666371 [Trichonephila clavipes]